MVDKDLERNVLIVGQGNENEDLFSSMLYTQQPSWVADEPPRLPLTCTAKIRYRQQDQNCTVSADQNGLKVDFEHPQRAVTPGQYVVFYDGDRCLGGAIIDRYKA